jgi:hypothetical protein
MGIDLLESICTTEVALGDWLCNVHVLFYFCFRITWMTSTLDN